MLLTPQKVLQIRLYRGIYLQKEFFVDMGLPLSPDKFSGADRKVLGEAEIALKQVQNTTQIVYSSGIAHKLSTQCQLSATDIAKKIVSAVLRDTLIKPQDQVFSPPFDELLQDSRIKASESGLVQLQVSDRAITAWLNLMIYHLPRLDQQGKDLEKDQKNRRIREDQYERPSTQVTPPSASTAPGFPSPPSAIFALQHTHARCFSLLGLAHRSRLIELNQEPLSIDWQLISPIAIPWLTNESQLVLNHPTERQLIFQLFAALDAVPSLVESDSPKTALRLARKLHQTFQAFYGACPIWGNAEKSTQLAQARLGLVMATQRLIHLLIADLLDVCAPLEL
ncbi:MAG: DALR anticodon-binding domain-containing protein [Kovacikia sp.]